MLTHWYTSKKLKYSFLFKFLIQFNLKFKIISWANDKINCFFFFASISMLLLIQCRLNFYVHTCIKRIILKQIKLTSTNEEIYLYQTFNSIILYPLLSRYCSKLTFLRKKKKKKKSAKAWNQIDRTRPVSPIDGRIPRLPVNSKRYQFHRTLDFSWEPMQRRQITEMQRHVQR